MPQFLWILQQPLHLFYAGVVWLIAPWFQKQRPKSQHPWVIGGHRGRIYADNARALHRHISQHSKQPILWIGNAPLCANLRAQGISCVERNTWKARLAVLRAPVLIYSHGEDDLDQYALLWRGRLGLRVYLNHCMNHLKSGQWYRPGIEKINPIQRKIYGWIMVNFDALLASSPLEAHNFSLALPHLASRIHLGGGAHLDDFVNMRAQPTQPRILWFPTFRETKVESHNLTHTIQQVIQDPQLLAWLATTQRTLVVCHHINSTLALHSDSPHLEFISPAQLDTELPTAELFISDYSGLLADWLLLDRPALFFTFDFNTYLQGRRLYLNYQDFAYGPWVQNAETLIANLISEQWKDTTLWHSRRQHWKKLFFPSEQAEYAANSLQAIQQLYHNFYSRDR